MSEPTTLDDVMRALQEVSTQLEKGDAKFQQIEDTFRKLEGVIAAAEILETVANTYRLAGLGGKIMKGVLAFLAAVAVAATAVREWWLG